LPIKEKAVNTITGKIILLSLFIFFVGSLFAQSSKDSNNPIEFAMPVLTVSPDARAAGMADIGVATMPSINDQAWNVSKYVFNESRAGISLSYVPWLRSIGNSNVNLLYLTGFHKLGNRQAIGASVRYFSLGDMVFLGENAEFIRASSPNEFTIDLSYSRLLGEYFSAGVAFRYLRSDIAGGYYSEDYAVLEAADGWAGDIGFYYRRPVRLGAMNSEVSAGLSISNIGTKMNYAYDKSFNQSYFLPTTLRLGGNLQMDLDYYNELSVSLEFSKYLVPTPPKRDANGNILEGENDDVSVIKGMIQSFYDAPGGFLEEMKEIMIGAGGEYIYSRMFKARAGYYHDFKNPNQQFFTIGAGITYFMFTLDLSYLFPVVSGLNSPLANTIRLTLSIDFGKTMARKSVYL
jgi:hypothetical protein